MTADDERPDVGSWRDKARELARAAFFARRPSGVLARLVHDSVVDAGAPPANHDLTFEHDHDLTIHLHVVTVDDHTSLSGSIEPADSRSLVLHSSGAGPPLESRESDAGRFAFPSVDHGLVRMRLEAPHQPTVWSDWFSV